MIDDDPEVPVQQENISEEAPLLKTRYPVRTRMRARKGFKQRRITTQPPLIRYPKRKMR